MASETPQTATSPVDLIAELMQLGEDKRTPAAGVIGSLLSEHGYTMRQIARATGIPRTTLHRWAETTTA